jgi:transposase-like protein
MSRQELKKQLVDLYNKGRSIDDICEEYDVPKSTFYRWIRKTRDDQIQLSDDDIRIIVTRLTALEEEATTYKKVLQMIKQAER